MAISSLYLGCVPDYLFDETDGKYTDTAFVLHRDGNGILKLRTEAACEALAASFACDIPAPLFDVTTPPVPMKVDMVVTDLDAGACNYLISTKYADTACEQVLCDSFGCQWIIYPSKYTEITENTVL